jgi:hypothetical protein
LFLQHAIFLYPLNQRNNYGVPQKAQYQIYAFNETDHSGGFGDQGLHGPQSDQIRRDLKLKTQRIEAGLH